MIFLGDCGKAVRNRGRSGWQSLRTRLFLIQDKLFIDEHQDITSSNVLRFSLHTAYHTSISWQELTTQTRPSLGAVLVEGLHARPLLCEFPHDGLHLQHERKACEFQAEQRGECNIARHIFDNATAVLVDIVCIKNECQFGGSLGRTDLAEPCRAKSPSVYSFARNLRFALKAVLAITSEKLCLGGVR